MRWSFRLRSACLFDLEPMSMQSPSAITASFGSPMDDEGARECRNRECGDFWRVTGLVASDNVIITGKSDQTLTRQRARDLLLDDGLTGSSRQSRRGYGRWNLRKFVDHPGACAGRSVPGHICPAKLLSTYSGLGSDQSPVIYLNRQISKLRPYPGLACLTTTP
jgi:hypothetical protein